MLDVLGLPSGAHQERNHGQRHMPDEHDRSGIDVDRADRRVIEQAAAQLRQGAIRAGYAGLTVAAGDTDLRAVPPRRAWTSCVERSASSCPSDRVDLHEAWLQREMMVE